MVLYRHVMVLGGSHRGLIEGEKHNVRSQAQGRSIGARVSELADNCLSFLYDARVPHP